MKESSAEKPRQRLRRWIITAMLLLLALTGCRDKISRPTAYYTLSPLSVAAANEQQQPDNPVTIGVGPLSLPDYLNRPQIVTRDGAAKLDYAETHRWGGRLEESILRVVAENLSAIIGTNRVKTFPWDTSFTPGYQVILDIKRFDGVLQDQVTLNAIWQLIDNSTNGRLLTRRSIITEPIRSEDKDDYEALVSAQSRALERLCREIGREIL